MAFADYTNLFTKMSLPSSILAMVRRERRLFSAATAPLRIVIAGGGAMGSSSAFWLTKMAQESGKRIEVQVVERDLQFKKVTYLNFRKTLNVSSRPEL